jgi:hypothetical protein
MSRIAEYVALRRAIVARGQLRVGLAVAGISVWAMLLVAVLIWLPYPVLAVVPLVPLAASFEAVRTLHAGAERIGRYLQVFHEEHSGAPAWERTAMALGPVAPGAAGHPLFPGVFLSAVSVNLLAVWLPGPVMVELATLIVPHLALVVWIARADRLMRRQRSEELARFEAWRADEGASGRAREGSGRP